MNRSLVSLFRVGAFALLVASAASSASVTYSYSEYFFEQLGPSPIDITEFNADFILVVPDYLHGNNTFAPAQLQSCRSGGVADGGVYGYSCAQVDIDVFNDTSVSVGIAGCSIGFGEPVPVCLTDPTHWQNAGGAAFTIVSGQSGTWYSGDATLAVNPEPSTLGSFLIATLIGMFFYCRKRFA